MKTENSAVDIDRNKGDFSYKVDYKNDAGVGLNEGVINYISDIKEDPDWVREFRLRYRVGFRVHDGKGNNYVPQSTLELTRDVTYDDADVLAKESEEQLLYRDMQGDMVQQIMRRLSSAQKPKA